MDTPNNQVHEATKHTLHELVLIDTQQGKLGVRTEYNYISTYTRKKNFNNKMCTQNLFDDQGGYKSLNEEVLKFKIAATHYEITKTLLQLLTGIGKVTLEHAYRKKLLTQCYSAYIHKWFQPL